MDDRTVIAPPCTRGITTLARRWKVRLAGGRIRVVGILLAFGVSMLCLVAVVLMLFIALGLVLLTIGCCLAQLYPQKD